MTALGKLLRTTAFKLTLVYLTVFALFAAFLLAYFAWNTRRLITEQITQTVDAEITGLAEQYRQGGIRRLVFVVDARSRRPGSSLYLVTTRAGEGLAGKPPIGVWTIPMAQSTTLSCVCFNCRPDSVSWLGAISKSGSGYTTSCSLRADGRWRSSSCSVSLVDFL